MTEYRIDRYRPDLRSKVLELQRHLWGGRRRPERAVLLLEVRGNPYLDDVAIYLATADGELAGMRGAFGARYVDEAGSPVAALCAGDLVVRPEDRAAFLPRRIMEAMASDLESRGRRYLLNFSASRFTHLTSLARDGRSRPSIP